MRSSIERIEQLTERSRYTIEWPLEYDHRFRTHRLLSAFHEDCENSRVSIDVQRVYNTPEQPSNRAFGITTPQ